MNGSRWHLCYGGAIYDSCHVATNACWLMLSGMTLRIVRALVVIAPSNDCIKRICQMMSAQSADSIRLKGRRMATPVVQTNAACNLSWRCHLNVAGNIYSKHVDNEDNLCICRWWQQIRWPRNTHLQKANACPSVYKVDKWVWMNDANQWLNLEIEWSRKIVWAIEDISLWWYKRGVKYQL